MRAAMAEQRARRSSSVRPQDRPERPRRAAASSRAAADRPAARRAVERPRGRRGSVLNPGFPRWAVVALVLVVVAFSAGWVVFSSSWFGVREVRIEGAAVLSDAEVREVVDLTENDALATVDTEAVARRVEKLAPVADAQVLRSWPGTLTVRVTERQPVATVQAGGKPWLIDIEGVPYAAAAKVGSAADGLLPLEIDDPSPDSLATRQAVAVIDALDAETTELVDHVTAESGAQVTLVLTDGRRVIWGDASMMQDKLTMLPAVLEHAGSVFDISSPTAIVIK